jgi:hypothetical protein
VTQAAGLRLAIAGALSGGLWFLLALAFDKGVQDFNFPVIPTNNLSAWIASGFSGVATGVCMALLFHRLLVSRSKVVFFTLPIAMLPTAIVAFSLLIWVAWFALGNRSGVDPLRRLVDILSIFLIYGLISLFTPLVYGCALLNQYALRSLLGRAT